MTDLTIETLEGVLAEMRAKIHEAFFIKPTQMAFHGTEEQLELAKEHISAAGYGAKIDSSTAPGKV